VSKAANGRSSIHRRKGGDGWEGWVSFGNDGPPATGSANTCAAGPRPKFAEKIKQLETDRDGGYGAVSRDTTLLEWLDYWVETKKGTVRPKTLAGYGVDRGYVVVLPYWNDQAHQADSGGRRTAVLQVLARPTCSTGTVAHLRRTLSAALSTGVGRGRLSRNPVKLAHTPTQEAEEVEPFSVLEAKAILAAARQRRNSARWSAGLALGLRQGEALGLQWPDVDLDHDTLRVRRQLQRLTWKHGCLNPSDCLHPGTGKPNRGVRIAPNGTAADSWSQSRSRRPGGDSSRFLPHW
jgi:integrase